MIESDLVDKKSLLKEHILQNIQSALAIATDSKGHLDDSIQLDFYNAVEDFYYQKDYEPVWSDTGRFSDKSRQLITYLDTAIMDGLYKEDYHYHRITGFMKTLEKDSVKKTDAVMWAKADMLLTDAFFHIISDLKQGRMIADSLSWKNDTSKFTGFFTPNLDSFLSGKNISSIFNKIQPVNPGYIELKKSIRSFIRGMDTFQYTFLKYSEKFESEDDSLKYISNLVRRISESEKIKFDEQHLPDSAVLATIISRYQRSHGINPEGKITKTLIKSLNNTDRQKFKRIIVTLDRYKELPDSMPEKYIWVNLPGYYLKVFEKDTVRLTSKIICGKPATPTPLLKSEINDIVIFPTWTVPTSIIKKEMLPGLKKNSGYLEKKGLKLYNNKGELVDPATVDWKKYSKGIPYQVKQGSGETNALGVMKFNFFNPFDVYLHDTNQRYLFGRNARALSHGCVRVQDWKGLACFIIKNDSINAQSDSVHKYSCDSIDSWIKNKQRQRIAVKQKIPIFIRYFSCEAENSKINFFEDIYDDDSKLIEAFFADK